MKIRIITFILAVSMLVSCVCGCASTAVASPVNEYGDFTYMIVRPESASSVVQNSCKDLRSTIKENFDCKITLTKDSSVEDSEDFYEILVGDTSRKASQEAKQILLDNRVNSANDFIVKVMGRKIIILALNDDMQSVAVEWFIENFCKTAETWSCLHSDYQFIYSPENVESGEFVNKVNDVDIGRFVVVQPRQIAYIVGRNVEKYIDYMAEFGYSIKRTIDTELEEPYEILVGNTTRKESKDVTVEGDNFVIKVIGNKIVIKGGNDLATYRGVVEFTNILRAAEEKKVGIAWSDGYTVNGKYDAAESGTYTLNFSDEFNGSVIDDNKWCYYGDDVETAKAEDSCLGGKLYDVDWKNRTNYPGKLSRDYVYQSNGSLVAGVERLNNSDFIAPHVGTQKTMVYRYGYFEIRAQLAGTPATTSLWFNGTISAAGSLYEKRFGKEFARGCMTEIDLLENFGRDVQFGCNVHHWYQTFKSDGVSTSGNGHNSLDGDSRYNGNSTNLKKYKYDSGKWGDTLADDFHLYSMYWDEEEIAFAFDGQVFCTYKYEENEMPSANCGMLYFLLGMRLGSPTYGLTYNRSQHGTYFETKLDYVRCYQTDEKNSQMIYAWPEDVETGTRKIIYPEHDIYGNY